MSPNYFSHEVRKDTMWFGIGVLIALMLIGTTFFHLVEGHTRFDSLYFVVMTMTTVGYGDIVPTSTIGKVLTMIYAFTGVPLFIFIAGFVVEQRVTGLVKSYVKHHVSQIVKLEDEIDTISEQVETIDQNIQEISEDVETISEDVEAISEDVNDIEQTPKIDIKEDIDVTIIKQ